MAEGRENSHAMVVSTDDISEYLRFAQSLVRRVGKELLSRFRTDLAVDNKSLGDGFDPVTDVDKKIERLMRDAITRQYPAHGIVGEEYDDQPGNGLTWSIDPIDGTRAFVTGMLHWGTLLGFPKVRRQLSARCISPSRMNCSGVLQWRPVIGTRKNKGPSTRVNVRRWLML